MLFFIQFFAFFLCAVYCVYLIHSSPVLCSLSAKWFAFLSVVFAPYFCRFAYLCLLSFCLTFFVTFPDYGCLSGGHGGEMGFDVLVVVLVPGRDFCGVSWVLNSFVLFLHTFNILISGSLSFPLLSVSDHVPSFSFRFGCFTRDC